MNAQDAIKVTQKKYKDWLLRKTEKWIKKINKKIQKLSAKGKNKFIRNRGEVFGVWKDDNFRQVLIDYYSAEGFEVSMKMSSYDELQCSITWGNISQWGDEVIDIFRMCRNELEKSE